MGTNYYSEMRCLCQKDIKFEDKYPWLDVCAACIVFKQRRAMPI